MAVHLEDLSLAAFGGRLAGSLGQELGAEIVERLYAHFRELRRWAPGLSLVGARESDALVERHYAESLRALPLLDTARRVLDLGSGAGFPGLVLAAARPDVDFVLVEARGRKAAFLRSAASKAGLACRIANVRVSARRPTTNALAGGIVDRVTVRALRVDGDVWAGIKPALAPGARLIRWEGAAPTAPWPDAQAGRAVELPGREGNIQEWRHHPC